jgi:hypothetical protein
MAEKKEACCQLVGSLTINNNENWPAGCIISINSTSRTEIIKECGESILLGATIGTVSITGYAASAIHVGCPGKASVSLNYIRRYDCNTNTVYMIPAGKGQSFVEGDVDGLATLIKGTGRKFQSYSASSSSGPASVYMVSTHEDGYGLDYTGSPMAINTDTNFIFTNFGLGSGPLYLQSFNLDCAPGELPVASYSFAFNMV